MPLQFLRHRLALAASLLPAAAALAQPATQPATRPDDREFVVSPAFADGPGAPSPTALLYTLAEQSAGDGADLYATAFGIADRRRYSGDNEDREAQFDALRATPIPRIDVEAAERDLYLDGMAFDFALDAARYERIEFSVPWREHGFETLLPNLNLARTLANSFHGRGKVHAAQGDFEAVLDDARLLVTMGRHVGAGDESFVVTGLVGVGISRLGLDLLREAGELPGFPNVFWPLSAVPLDFSVVEMLDLERESMYATFPALRQPERYTAADWSAMLATLDELGGSGATLDRGEEGRAAHAEAMAQALLPRARAWLAANDVEVTGDYPILAAYTAGTYEAAWRRAMGYAALPPHQAVPRLRDHMGDTFPAGGGVETAEGLDRSPLLAASWPSIDRAAEVVAGLERERAAMLIVEALRDHAARHGGLPATLAEVELPLRDDPLTGRAFGYEVEGEAARIVAPAVRPEFNETLGLGFTWTVRLREPGPLAEAEAAELPAVELPADPLREAAGRLGELSNAILHFGTDDDRRLPASLEDLVAAGTLTAEAAEALEEEGYVLVTTDEPMDALFARVGGGDVVYAYRLSPGGGRGGRAQVLLGSGVVADVPVGRLRELGRVQGFEVD